jgi:hypothetical protein
MHTINGDHHPGESKRVEITKETRLVLAGRRLPRL